MLGMSSMLSDYGIDNVGLQLIDKSQIHALEAPFIVHIRGDFALVEHISEMNIRLVQSDTRTTLSLTEFYKIWTGKVLIAESGKSSIEPGYWQNLQKNLFRKFQQGYILTFILFLLAYSFVSQQIIYSGFISLFFINLIGLYVCCLLLQKQIHIQSDYIDKICSIFRQSDCNNILESKVALLGGIWGWSEIGFGYFLSNIIMICFFQQLIPCISIINLFSLCFSFWSIWYQKMIAKQWCSLCIAVMFILWSTFIINILFGFIAFESFNIFTLLIVVCIYMFFVFNTHLLVGIVSKSQNATNIRYELNSLKRNEDIFIALLKKQSYHATTIENSHVLFGNLDSNILVTVFSNPHCTPCAKMHQQINQLLEYNKNICIQYIFSSFNEELEISNKYLIGVYQQRKEDAKKIYKHWFEEGRMNNEIFFNKYAININSPDVFAEYELHAQWKERTKIKTTPTILINGYKLPNYFKIEDLRYFSKIREI